MMHTRSSWRRFNYCTSFQLATTLYWECPKLCMVHLIFSSCNRTFQILQSCLSEQCVTPDNFRDSVKFIWFQNSFYTRIVLYRANQEHSASQHASRCSKRSMLQLTTTSFKWEVTGLQPRRGLGFTSRFQSLEISFIQLQENTASLTLFTKILSECQVQARNNNILEAVNQKFTSPRPDHVGFRVTIRPYLVRTVLISGRLSLVLIRTQNVLILG